MKITDIKRQERRPDRFNIYLDGRFGFALSELDVIKSKIEIGKEIEEAELMELKNDDQRAKILNKAFGYLARRSHSEKELKIKLLRKFENGDLVEKAILRLKDLGYLNDEKFTREWIESRLCGKAMGRILIKRELLAKGVEAGLVEKMLNLVYNGDREKLELREFITKRKPEKGGFKAKKRFISLLLRRGFLWEDIKELLEAGDELDIK